MYLWLMILVIGIYDSLLESTAEIFVCSFMPTSVSIKYQFHPFPATY